MGKVKLSEADAGCCSILCANDTGGTVHTDCSTVGLSNWNLLL